jgi:endonuclease III
MKNGAQYAKLVKRYYNRTRSSVTSAPTEDDSNPLAQLILAQLSWDAAPLNAQKAARRLSEQMIDLNEVRVSTPREISAVIRDCVPNPMECARAISRSLNSIYQRENLLSLDHLEGKGRREARQYLDSLDGVNAHASASVMLWSLSAHAIPVNQRLLRALRKEGLVDPDAEAPVVQAFLERHVAAAEARLFCRVMEKLASQKGAPPPAEKKAKRKRTNKKSKSARAQTSTSRAAKKKTAARR